jgi:hypothetical protein
MICENRMVVERYLLKTARSLFAAELPLAIEEKIRKIVSRNSIARLCTLSAAR